MPAPPIVAVQFVFAFTAYGLAAKWYIAPKLAGRPLRATLPPLLLVHLVRPISLWLLAPGIIVLPTIPRGFAEGTAYGDLVSAVLALVAAVLVRNERPGALAAAWFFNAVGTLDALRNVVVGVRTGAPEHMGAAVLVPAYGVPLLLVSHMLIFYVLSQHRRERAT